jgi:hypothetical protein
MVMKYYTEHGMIIDSSKIQGFKNSRISGRNVPCVNEQGYVAHSIKKEVYNLFVVP